MKTKKCGDYGTIEYRLPNIPEAMIALGEMGLNSKTLSDSEAMTENELIYTARLIEKLGRFVGKIKLEIDGNKITKYEDVLNYFVMMEYLNEIGAEIFEALGGSPKKKS